MALTPVDVLGALEEPWHVVLQDGQGLVELLEHTDHRVVLLNILLGLPHRYLCVEPPGNVEVSCMLLMIGLQYWLVAGTGASWGTQHRTHQSPGVWGVGSLATHVQSSAWPQKNMVCRRWSPKPSLR